MIDEPAIYNGFRIFAGETWEFSLNWKDDNGMLIDLTGYSARLRFFPSRKDRSVTLRDLSDGAGITLAATSPNFYALIDKSESTFTTPPGYCLIEFTQPDGKQFAFLQGKVTYTP
jgi:hypothetical protein